MRWQIKKMLPQGELKMIEIAPAARDDCDWGCFSRWWIKSRPTQGRLSWRWVRLPTASVVAASDVSSLLSSTLNSKAVFTATPLIRTSASSKRTIKVYVSCSWQCRGTSAPSDLHLHTWKWHLFFELFVKTKKWWKHKTNPFSWQRQTVCWPSLAFLIGSKVVPKPTVGVNNRNSQPRLFCCFQEFWCNLASYAASRRLGVNSLHRFRPKEKWPLPHLANPDDAVVATTKQKRTSRLSFPNEILQLNGRLPFTIFWRHS